MDESIDWGLVGDEVSGYLQDLIRIDTTNPPGNEGLAARYIADVLEREGYTTTLSESAPGRGNVTTRLAGGPQDPLLLLGHTDVVAADAPHWTHPPFSGELVDGFIWGRGALDMKNMVAAELMIMLLLIGMTIAWGNNRLVMRMWVRASSISRSDRMRNP